MSVTHGGGRQYNAEAMALREQLGAEGLILIVLGGARGHGFEVQAPLEVQLRLPYLLREIAARIEADLRSGAAFT